MALIIEDADGSQLTLNDSFKIKGYSWSRMTKTAKRAYSQGVSELSDLTFGKRDLEVSGVIWRAERYVPWNITGTAADSYAIQSREIEGFLAKDTLKLYPDTTDFYWMISHATKATHRWIKGAFGRGAEYKVKLLLSDPFLQAASETVGVAILPIEVTVTTLGNVDVYPEIVVTGVLNAGGSNNPFTITNNTDSRQIEINDNGFVAGTSVRIDCENGTVYRTNEKIVDVGEIYNVLGVLRIKSNPGLFNYSTGGNIQVGDTLVVSGSIAGNDGTYTLTGLNATYLTATPAFTGLETGVNYIVRENENRTVTLDTMSGTFLRLVPGANSMALSNTVNSYLRFFYRDRYVS
tara:strand:+ start:4733 stop:5779 length:1047 start_codon:yes stop_codon:yes gene_type:complete